MRPKHLLVVAAAAFVGLAISRAGFSSAPTITFLAVGQGDCTLWRDGDVNILIDVGPKTREGFDAGSRIVIPKLRSLGVGQVALILITHPDADHIGGLGSIHRRFPDAKVVASAEFKTRDSMKLSLQEAGVSPEKVLWLAGHNQIALDHSSLDVYAPTLAPAASDNEGSLFIRVKSGAATAVITGDAYMANEDVVESRLHWTAQVLKVGHHGSRTSTGDGFVKQLLPVWAVISCGKNNMFGHPHPSVLQTLKRHTVEVLRTDMLGDITFTATPSGFVPR
ncbi:MAG TPA: MBL fold metallo-hydrolase [Fimbriimonadaceae bacterium]|nr:MBL fold metallo-hydrolase [Fimbriimonadaceae bacterium]